MANKIASSIKCVLNKKIEPFSGRWYTDNENPGSPTPTASEQDKKRDNKNAKMKSTYSLRDEDDKNEMTNVMP
jgi:hypothetical protein